MLHKLLHNKSSSIFMASEKSVPELSLNFFIIVSWIESIGQNDSLWIPPQTSRTKNSLEDVNMVSLGDG